MMTFLALVTLAAGATVAHGAYLTLQQSLTGASLETVGAIIDTTATAAGIAIACGAILAINLALGA
jgi:hypothetical protein